MIVYRALLTVTSALAVKQTAVFVQEIITLIMDLAITVPQVLTIRKIIPTLSACHVLNPVIAVLQMVPFASPVQLKITLEMEIVLIRILL